MPAHPEFTQGTSVLKQTRILEVVQIRDEEDRATMSNAAKEIRDALKASGNGGGSEKWDQHSESSTVNQDEAWGVIPWYRLSGEQLTGEARHDRVDASWDLV